MLLLSNSQRLDENKTHYNSGVGNGKSSLLMICEVAQLFPRCFFPFSPPGWSHKQHSWLARNIRNMSWLYFCLQTSEIAARDRHIPSLSAEFVLSWSHYTFYPVRSSCWASRRWSGALDPPEAVGHSPPAPETMCTERWWHWLPGRWQGLWQACAPTSLDCRNMQSPRQLHPPSSQLLWQQINPLLVPEFAPSSPRTMQ